MCVFQGLKGLVPGTTGEPVATNDPMAYLMRWEGGESTAMIFNGFEPSKADLTFYLTRVTCHLAATVIQGGDFMLTPY